MPSKENREGATLRIQSQYLVSVSSITRDMGWYEGDPIKLDLGDDGVMTIENLTDPEVLERRLLKRSDKRRTNVVIDDSFRNLIWMHKDELSAIREGSPSAELLSVTMRRGMLRKGVLVKMHSGVNTGPTSVLSEEASQVLDEVLAEES